MPPTVFHSVGLQTWHIRNEISITFCLNVSEPYVTYENWFCYSTHIWVLPVITLKPLETNHSGLLWDLVNSQDNWIAEQRAYIIYTRLIFFKFANGLPTVNKISTFHMIFILFKISEVSYFKIFHLEILLIVYRSPKGRLLSDAL